MHLGTRDRGHRQGSGIGRLGRGDEPPCCTGVPFGTLHSRQPQKRHHRQLDSRLTDRPRRLELSLDRCTLDHCLQGRLVSGFRAKVDNAQTESPQAAESFRSQLENRPRIAVDPHPLHVRQLFLDLAENSGQPVKRRRQRIAVCKKNPTYSGHSLGRPTHFLEDLFHRPNTEILAAVHRTVGTTVPRTPEGQLKDQRAGLRRGAKDRFDERGWPHHLETVAESGTRPSLPSKHLGPIILHADHRPATGLGFFKSLVQPSDVGIPVVSPLAL